MGLLRPTIPTGGLHVVYRTIPCRGVRRPCRSPSCTRVAPSARVNPVAQLCGEACRGTRAGGQAGSADWARNYGEPWRTRLGFTHPKGPRPATLLAHIAVAVLEAYLAQWTQQVCVALHGATVQEPRLVGVAMDGKTLRTSRRCGAEESHRVRLCRHRLGVVFGQVAVGDKANEITARDDLLALLMRTGITVTGDAGTPWADLPRTPSRKRYSTRAMTT